MGILSSIGDWVEEKYNNLTTAISITTTPSTYITGTGGYTTPTTNSNGISSDITASVGNSSTSSINQTAEEKAIADSEAIYGSSDSDDSSSSNSSNSSNSSSSSSGSSSSVAQTPSSYITGSNLTSSDTGYNGISTETKATVDYDAAKWVQTVIENIQKSLNTMKYTDYEDNAPQMTAF
ncbi:MAG: hypothetical protein R3Y32_09170 [Bacillota bacterium]